MAGIGKSQEWMREYANVPYRELGALVPGAVDPHERIKLLDKEGVDVAFLYPTLGLGWQFDCEDPQLSAAYCRVYNDWLVDFCKDYPDRLISIALVPLRDVNEVVKELKKAAKMEMKGAMITPAPANGIGYGYTYFDPFWTVAQELEMPVTIHVSFNPNYLGSHVYAGRDDLRPRGVVFFQDIMSHSEFIMSLANMMCEGVFERFPGLRMNMVEDGSGWIIHWLDKMDFAYKRTVQTCPSN